MSNNSWIADVPFSTYQTLPKKATVITVGYQSFVIQPRFLADFLHAAAVGDIQAADKQYKSAGYQVVIKGNVDVSVEHLDVAQDNEPEIKKLRERLMGLENSNG